MRLCFTFAILLCASSWTKALASASETLILSVGETRALPVHGKLWSISEKEILALKATPTTVYIVGKRPGRATLQPLSGGSAASIDVRVLSASARFATAEMEKAIARLRGLTLDRAALPEIQVIGRLLRVEDLKLLIEIARRNRAPWILRARPHPEIQSDCERELAVQMKDAGLYGLSLLWQDFPIVELPPARSADDERLRILGIAPRVQAQALELAPMLRVLVTLAEVRHSRARQIGIEWPTSAEGRLLPKFQFPTSDELLVTLKAAENDGEGKILASPALVVRSGKEASFLAGGEIPIKQVTKHSQTVAWKKYGLSLHLTPTLDPHGRMSVGIATEISTIDLSAAVDGVPGLIMNRVETHFDLKETRTIVLSGLIRRDSAQSRAGLPFLKDIPILGALFSSRSFLENDSELFVFVTPEPLADGPT